MATRIQVRRDTLANWTLYNPTLANGEITYVTDTAFIKVGDGSTPWNSLPYATQLGNVAVGPAGSVTGGTGSFVANITGGNIVANTATYSAQYNYANGVSILASFNSFALYANANLGTATTNISALQANVGAYEIYANANLGTATTNISALQANVGAYEIYANANLGTATTNITTLFSNAASQATALNIHDANLGTATTNISALQANVGAYEIYANANLGTATTNITTLLANAGTQQASINSLATNANANTAAYLAAGVAAVRVTNTTEATGSATGAFQVTGGASIGANLYVSGNLVVAGNSYVLNTEILTQNEVISGSVTAGSYFYSNGAPLNYGNVQAAAYLAGNTDPTISNLNGNAASQAVAINTINANLGTATTNISTLQANVGAYEFWANTNFAYANTTFATGASTSAIQANLGAYQIYANANLGTATTNIISLFSNAGTQQSSIDSLRTGANANTTAFLTTLSFTAPTANVSLYDTVTPTTTNAIFYPQLVDKTSGNVATYTAGLSYNPSTGYLYASYGTFNSVYAAAFGNLNSTFTGASISTPNAYHTTVTAATVNAATIGNTGATLTGTLSTATQNSVTTMTGLTLIGAAGQTTTVAGNLTIGGNLSVTGQSVSIGSSTLSVADPIINLHTASDLTPLLSNDGADIGLKFHYYDGADSAAFVGRANDTGFLEWYSRGSDTGNIFTGTAYGTIKSGALWLANTTASTGTTSATAGALYVAGGAGIAGALNVGGTVTAAGVDLVANAASQAVSLNAINANLGTVVATTIPGINTSIATLNANVGAYETWANLSFAYANANVGTATTNISTIQANLGAYQIYANANLGTATTNISALQANLGTVVSTTIPAVQANLGTATTNISALQANLGTVVATTIPAIQANLGAYQIYANANAAAQAVSITSLATNANANTAAYLPSYTGVLAPSTITTTGNVTVGGNLIVQGNIYELQTEIISQSVVVAQSVSAALHTYANGVDITTQISTLRKGAGLSNVNIANGNDVITFGVYNPSTGTASNSFTVCSNIVHVNTNLKVFNNSQLDGTLGVAGNVTVSNIAGSNFTWSNGVSILQGVGGTYTNSNVAAYLPTHTGNVTAANFIGNIRAAGTTNQIVVTGNIVPSVGNLYSLGSPTQWFTGLYISGNTINLGGQQIKATPTGFSFQTSGGGRFDYDDVYGGFTNFYAAGGLQPDPAQLYNLKITGGYASTNATTGALVVNGGVGITGNLYAGGQVFASDFILTSTGQPISTVYAGNAYVQSAITTANAGVVSYVNTKFNTVQDQLSYANASMTATNSAIIVANTSMRGYVDTANTALKNYVDGQISGQSAATIAYVAGVNNALTTAINSNIGTVNTAITTANSAVISYVDAKFGSLATGANANTAAYLNNYSGNITVGNILATGFYFANGTPFISAGGGSGTYSNANVTSYLPVYSGNISATNINATNVYASYVYGTYSNVTLLQSNQSYITTVGNLGNLTVAGNINAANMVLGTPLLYTQRDAALRIGANTNNRAQIAIQNTSNGYNATTNFVAYADNGDDGNAYVQTGIVSSGYVVGGNELLYPADAYVTARGPLIRPGNLITRGGNLLISTATARDIIFSTNGAGVANQVGRFVNTQGLVIYPTTQSANVYTGALVVQGGAAIQKDVYVGGNLFVAGNTTTVNTYVQTEYVTGNEVVAGNLIANSGISSTSTTTGAVQVLGGLGVTGNVYAGTVRTGSVYATGLYWAGNGNVISTGGTSGNITLRGSLTDVVIQNPAANDILTWNGAYWVNNAPGAASVASTIFIPQATSDLGLVTDLGVSHTEDNGTVTEIAAFAYDMGVLRLDGVVSLNNLDQSVKSDYLGYSIIFGF